MNPAMQALKAHVKGGRLVLDEPTDLPEGESPVSLNYGGLGSLTGSLGLEPARVAWKALGELLAQPTEFRDSGQGTVRWIRTPAGGAD